MEMNKFLLMSLSVALILGLTESFEFHERELETEDSLWDLYERWRSHHTVSMSLDDKNRRFNVFKANAQHVHNTNKMNKPYKLKLNKFADMTNHEFRRFYAGSKIKHHRMLRGDKLASQTFMYENVHSFPLSMDWREKGAVTPVKDQGQCGKHRSSLTKVARSVFFKIRVMLTSALRALFKNTKYESFCIGILHESINVHNHYTF